MVTRLQTRSGTPAIVVGVLACLLIVAGSTSVGWIGPGSSVREWPIIDWPRATDERQNWASFVVVLGGLLLIGAWLRVGAVARAAGPDGVRTVVTAAVAWGIPLIAAVPLYSRDLFAYVGQGRLLLNHINPYLQGIAAENGWYAIGVDPRWANTRTPYGPVFLYVEKLVVGASGESPVVAVALFRLLAVLAVVGMSWFAYRIAVVRGLDRAMVLWVVAASPVTMYNFVVGGHNDALMLGLLVAAGYYALVRHPVVAVVLVTLAVGVKPIAIIALPVIGIIWAGPDRTLKTTLKYWAICTVIAGALLGVIGVAVDVGFGWIGALTTPGSVSHWYAPVNWLASFSGWIVRLVGLDGDLVKSVIKAMALAVMAAIVAWVMLTMKKIDPLLRLATAFAAAVLLSPFIHPWYAAWVIVLFAIAGVRPGAQSYGLAAASVFFAWVSVSDTLDAPRAYEGGGWAIAVRTVMSIAGLVALALYFCRQYDIDLRSLPARARGLWSRRPRRRSSTR
ncbi:MAG: polyprenol phosphomannose-dependent alpha 1,6 mannosyltransferase MptB [Nakamurella sp.]